MFGFTGKEVSTILRLIESQYLDDLESSTSGESKGELEEQ